MHLFVAALEEPEKFEPTLHVAYEEKPPWLKLADDLPTCIGPDCTKGKSRPEPKLSKSNKTVSKSAMGGGLN